MAFSIVPRLARGRLFFQIGDVLLPSLAQAATAWAAVDAHRLDLFDSQAAGTLRIRSRRPLLSSSATFRCSSSVSGDGRSTCVIASGYSRGQFHSRMKPGARSQPDQEIQTELIDLSALDIRDARLSDSQCLRSFRLRHAARSQPALQSGEQHGSNLQLLGLSLRKQVLKDTAAGRRDVPRPVTTLLALRSFLHHSPLPGLRHRLEPALRQIQIATAGLLGLLLEAMQNVDAFRPRCEVDHSEGA